MRIRVHIPHAVIKAALPDSEASMPPLPPTMIAVDIAAGPANSGMASGTMNGSFVGSPGAFASFAAELNTSLIAIMNRMIPPDNSSDACVRFRYFRIAPPQNRKRSRTPSAIRDSLITIKRYLAAPVPSSSAIKTGRLPSGFITRKNKISVETKLSINTPLFSLP